MSDPKLTKAMLEPLANELVVAGRTRGARAVVVSVATEDGWYVAYSGGLEALGLAHLSARTLADLVDRSAVRSREPEPS